MKYEVIMTTGLKKDYKNALKRGRKREKILKVIELLANGQPLPVRYNDHLLLGNWSGHRECHIEPDWLLIYYVCDNILTLTLTRTGTHSDLF